mgnify:CR=1 FL=1
MIAAASYAEGGSLEELEQKISERNATAKLNTALCYSTAYLLQSPPSPLSDMSSSVLLFALSLHHIPPASFPHLEDMRERKIRMHISEVMKRRLFCLAVLKIC